MKKKIITAAAIAIALSIGGTALYQYWPVPSIAEAVQQITAFKDDRDTQEILNIFAKDRYWLISSENYSPEFMLKNRAPNMYDERYFGKLNIKVLYDNNQFVGFTAYYLKNFFIGQLLFLAVKPECRGKGYAQKLLKYAIDDLKKQGATIITLVTRTANAAARALYIKAGFKLTHEEDGFVYYEIRP